MPGEDQTPGAANNVETAAETVKAPKRPPPEKEEDIRLRSLVILSFWIVVICLGIPVWIWTTSIYRAKLPLDDMLAWADGKACKPSFPLQITIDASPLQEAESAQLIRLTQHTLDDQNEFSPHHLRLRPAISPSSPISENASIPIPGADFEPTYIDDDLGQIRRDDDALVIRLILDETLSGPEAQVQKQTNVLNVKFPSSLIPSPTSSSSTLLTFLASTLQDLVAEEQGITEHTLSTSQASKPQIARSAQLTTKLANRATRALKYAPTYHLTISLFTPMAGPSSWAIEAALADYLSPLLDSLSTISNFTLDTQVQLHAAFAPSVASPVYDEEAQVWTLGDEDLSGFINAAEWPLSPSIGTAPTLNFILYVPDPNTVPLVVKGSHASSWLIPQWGGIVIFNEAPAPSSTNVTLPHSHLSQSQLRPALLTFARQLLSLLGVPESPPSLPLQLQTLTRVSAASLLLSASSTLGSLARLTKALPSIAIPETVSAAVDTTLTHLQQTCAALKEGRFQEALEHGRVAEAQAERGFFEKSMVGQVYFPEEHKVAVYLPLLGPVGVPLVLSAVKEIRRIVQARRAQRK